MSSDNEKTNRDLYNRFKEFVINTNKEYKDENFQYCPKYNELKNMHYERWKFNFSEAYDNDAKYKYLCLELKYENKNNVLINLYGYYSIINAGVRTYLHFSENHENLGETVINYLDNFVKDPNMNLESKFELTDDILKMNFPELKDEKFPAPEWLVFPFIPNGSIGWRMGCGEDYLTMLSRSQFNGMLFRELFKIPKNWQLGYQKEFFEYLNTNFALYAIAWEPKGKAKYELNKENMINPDEKFVYKLFNEEFQIAHEVYKCLKEAYEDSKNKIENETVWNKAKHSILLNILYFKIMEDSYLINYLMKNLDKKFRLKSDDSYWICEEDNLTLALMEIQDELARLFKNNDKIDWFYTEFLKQAPYYEFNPNYQNNMANENSAEYMVYKQTYLNAKLFVRDTNLTKTQKEKYKIGKIIQERAFVDATSKIGKMTTTHRYAILSNHITDLSEFESNTNWNLHTTHANSKFKVLDVYEYKNKTQILLLHLFDGFESVFVDDNTIKQICVENARKIFEKTFEKQIINEVNTKEWVEHCAFPVGLDKNDEYWPIE